MNNILRKVDKSYRYATLRINSTPLSQPKTILLTAILKYQLEEHYFLQKTSKYEMNENERDHSINQ